MRKKSVIELFNLLLKAYGEQKWWPITLAGDIEPTYNDVPLTSSMRYEIALGAVLTQNTNWNNVKKAIANLNKAKLISPSKIISIPDKKLETAIRPSGYFRMKTIKLKILTEWWIENIDEQKRPTKAKLDYWRKKILAVKGIGPETADSILLYCFNLPTFVIDSYTKRIMARHYGTPIDIPYEELRDLFMKTLPHEPKLFNEFHALFVKLGKVACRKNECLSQCPLR